MIDKNKSIILAMSGGVDSSVAAALLLEAGWNVTGVFLDMLPASQPCRGLHEADDARRVAERLGIALEVLDLREDFTQIIDYFLAEYVRGRTPNPCIYCNTLLKFARLIELAETLGADCIATGHYARIVEHGGRAAIARSRAGGRDQSYALFGVTADSLGRVVLPMGESADKSGVRDIARKLGLGVHDKPDSQEICFIEDDYADFLAGRAPRALRAGRILSTSGEQLGLHDGYGRFTIGQRRGLKIAVGSPLYVTRIDPHSGDVTVGPRAELASSGLKASGANWHNRPGEDEFNAVVQIRYNHPGTAGRVRITSEDTFEVEFAEPVFAVAPGQAAVVYDGDVLLGGGWIE